MKTFYTLILFSLFTFLLACTNEKTAEPKNKIDSNSYNLGIIGGFSELVNCGVKKMALSEALSPTEMDGIYEEALKIAERNHVQIYRESDLIVTNLFPSDVAVNKDVLLIYTGNTKNEYLKLKAEAKQLEKEGKYNGEAKMNISKRFGRLLSYPPYRLNELLAENTSYRTIRDQKIKASSVFFYYKNIEQATLFYTQKIGSELVADYIFAKILRIAPESYLILVDEKYGMHKTTESKEVKISLVSDDINKWYDYAKSQKLKFNTELKKTAENSNFSIIDPSGYTIEFIEYYQQPSNENILAQLNYCKPINESENHPGIKASINTIRYNNLSIAENFYNETLGLKQINSNYNSIFYEISSASFLQIEKSLNIVSNENKKAVNIGFIIEDIDNWHQYCLTNKPFVLNSNEIEVGEENKYKAFVGFDPEGYYLEFDSFYNHNLNTTLMKYLNNKN